MMAERGWDAIVTAQNTGHEGKFQADSRYLTHCGGGSGSDIAAVFPLDGDVTVIATSAERWDARMQDWVIDVREARRQYGRRLGERLQELHLEHAKIGVAGLAGSIRAPDGMIPYHTMRHLQEALPNATFEDATYAMQQVRSVKSDEEIAFLARSMELIDLGYESILQHARPGVSDWSVWGQMMGAMAAAGSELPVHCNWIAGPHPGRTMTRPTFRPLEPGDLIVNEVEASWGGYHAQGVQPIGILSVDPIYVELMKVQAEVFDAAIEILTPGVTPLELDAACRKAVERAAPTNSAVANCTASLTMHGRGMGEDIPLVTLGGREAGGDERLRVPLPGNSVFVVKPAVRTEDRRYSISWGDTVVTTPSGGRRLGKRPQQILFAGR
jgi:Xaa-Pro dipeptidase